MWKKMAKWLAGILLFPVALVLLVFFLLYLPPVQNLLQEKLSAQASQALGMQVGVGGIRLSLPFDLLVQDVEVVDGEDSLLVARELVLDVDLLPLFAGKVEINSFSFGGIRLNTAGLIPGMELQGSLGRFFLQSHGVDLFREDVVVNKVEIEGADVSLLLGDMEEEEDTTASSPLNWKILLESLALKDIKFRMEMPADSLHLQAAIGEARLDTAQVDLGKGIYALSRFVLSDSQAGYRVGAKRTVKGFNPSDLFIDDLALEVASARYAGTDLSAVLRNVSFKEHSGLELAGLQATVEADSATIRVPSLQLRTPFSRIAIQASADWATVADPETGNMSFSLRSDVGKEDVLLFLSGMSEDFRREYPYRPLVLRMEAGGNLSKLDLKDCSVQLPGALEMSVHGSGASLADSLRRNLDMDLALATEDLDFVLCLLDDSLRSTLAIPRDMSLGGKVKMEGSAYAADLLYRENESSIRVEGRFDSATEAYSARLGIDSLMLADFLPNDSLYGLTASVRAQGKGVDIFSGETRTHVRVDVDKFRYASYDLDNIGLSARLANHRAVLALKGDNSLLDVETRVEASLYEKRIKAGLDLDLRKLDLYALGAVASPLGLSLGMKVEAATNMKENHRAKVAVTGIGMQAEKQTFHPKDIDLFAMTDVDSTFVALRAGDLVVGMHGGNMAALTEGTARLMEELDKQLADKYIRQDVLKQCFPDLRVRVVARKDNPLSNMLSKLANVGFEEMKLQLDMSSREGLNAYSYIHSLQMDSMRIDTVRLRLDQNPEGMKLLAGVSNGEENEWMTFRALADGEIGNNHLQLLLKYFDDEGREGVQFGVRAAMRREGISLHFIPDEPVLAYKKFHLNKRNYVYMGKDRRVRANVSLLDSAGMGVRVYSLPADTTVLQDLALEIRRVALGELHGLLPSLPDIGGMFNAEAHLIQEEGSLQLAADVQLDSLRYEQNRIGDIAVGAVYLPGMDAASNHYLNAFLSHDGKEILAVEGEYDTKDDGYLDADVALSDIPLRLANGFIPDQLAALSGNLDGQVNVKGAVSKLSYNGELVFDSVDVAVQQYGVHLRMEKKPIRIEDSQLVFDKYNIYARNDNPFVINGKVDFADLSRMNADLFLRANNYELVNAKKTKESLLFGKVYADLFAGIKGPLDALQIRGNINLLGTTDVTYVLKDTPLTAAQDRLGELVTFTNFNDTAQAVSREMPDVRLGGMDMLMVVHIDQAARVNAELNADGSDYVRLEGGGDLSLQYTDYGGLQLTGRYTLASGKLKYSLMMGLSREFTVQNGSYVDFTGNAMDPRLNITAVYTKRTSVTEDDQQRMVTFNSSIAIKNTLENLAINFDLAAPEDATIQNELAAMSAEDRSRLAVTMIVIGVYQGGSGGGFDMGGSMNSLLNSAIQGITSNIKAVDISLGVETDGNSGTTKMDYSYQISKRFWNDRFNIIIGGKISTGEDVQQGEQTFIDNISIEYRLDDSGTRYIKLFHDKNYDSILDGEITETGVGVVLRKKMSRLGELFIFRRNKKNAKKE